MTKTEAKTRGGEVTVRPAVGTRTWQGYREHDQAQLRGLPGATDSAVRKINAAVVRKVRQKSWEEELRASDLEDLVQEVHISSSDFENRGTAKLLVRKSPATSIK